MRQLIKLDQNEAAVSMNLVRFANWPDALYCLVGVAKDLHLNPRSVLSVGMGQSKKWSTVQHDIMLVSQQTLTK